MKPFFQRHFVGERSGLRVWIAGAAWVVVATVLLASCGATHDPSSQGSSTSSSEGATRSTTRTTATAPDGTASSYNQGRVVPPPETPTTVPRETSEIPVTQYVGAGQQIIITRNGFWPQTLDANMKVPITWTNLSGRPQKVIFDDIPVSSATIPAGWQYVWKSYFGGSYAYKSASGFQCRARAAGTDAHSHSRYHDDHRALRGPTPRKPLP